MYTEAEAGTKWCVRSVADTDSTAKCVGTKCMAWRWGPDTVHGSAPMKEAIAPLMPPPSPAGFWVKGAEYSRDIDVIMYHWGLFPHRGYCGLAGRPEVS